MKRKIFQTSVFPYALASLSPGRYHFRLALRNTSAGLGAMVKTAFEILDSRREEG